MGSQSAVTMREYRVLQLLLVLLVVLYLSQRPAEGVRWL